MYRRFKLGGGGGRLPAPFGVRHKAMPWMLRNLRGVGVGAGGGEGVFLDKVGGGSPTLGAARPPPHPPPTPPPPPTSCSRTCAVLNRTTQAQLGCTLFDAHMCCLDACNQAHIRCTSFDAHVLSSCVQHQLTPALCWGTSFRSPCSQVLRCKTNNARANGSHGQQRAARGPF